MKASLLLPVASAAFAAANFIVIPDEQTIQLVAFNNHQAPITSEDKPKVAEPERRPHDGEPYYGKEIYHTHGPEYILRRRYRKDSSSATIKVDTDALLGFSPANVFANGEERFGPSDINRFYRSGGRHHHHRHGGPHVDSHDGDKDWPPKPPSWPPKPPGDGPPQPPHPKPEPPPHWPPKPPGHPDHPGRKPKHPPHRGWKPHPPNETIWQLISKSKYTTKFAEIVSEHEDIVTILNSTISNYTLFVPTNRAFEKFKKAPDSKPPKEIVKKFLTYHISTDAFPVLKLLLGHTIPSALDGGDIGGAQRIRVALGPGGLTVNFYSRVVAGNIFATNGVIHAVDSVLFPPPPIGRIIKFFPSEFSTFLLGLHVTNLTQEVPHEHTGGTLFAPPNSAFQKLGPKVNAFLFSPWGRKYLKALLKYHIVVNETLYSDAYYHPSPKSEIKAKEIPKGNYHVDLPTLLEGKHLSIDISRFGGLITIIVNAQATVKVEDVIAKDGVIQIVGNILVPPKKPPTGDMTAQQLKEFQDAEDLENTMGMSVKQFCERFEGLVDDDGVVTGEYIEEDILTVWEH